MEALGYSKDLDLDRVSISMVDIATKVGSEDAVSFRKLCPIGYKRWTRAVPVRVHCVNITGYELSEDFKGKMDFHHRRGFLIHMSVTSRYLFTTTIVINILSRVPV